MFVIQSGDFFLMLLKMMRQHVVHKTEHRHLVFADNAQQQPDPLVELLGHIDGLPVSGRRLHFFRELRLVVGRSGLATAGGGAASAVGGGAGAAGAAGMPSTLLAAGGMLRSSCRNELMMNSLSISSTRVFFAMAFNL